MFRYVMDEVPENGVGTMLCTVMDRSVGMDQVE